MSRHRRAAPSARPPRRPPLQQRVEQRPSVAGDTQRGVVADGHAIEGERRPARAQVDAWTALTVRPGAAGSTRNTLKPSFVCAGTRTTSATWAQGTKCLVPWSVQPRDVRVARVETPLGFQPQSWCRGRRRWRGRRRPRWPEASAAAARVRSARPGQPRARWGSTGSDTPRAPSPPARWRFPPCRARCRRRRARQTEPAELGHVLPHGLALTSGSSHSARTTLEGQCASRKARAESFSSCWSESNAKSIASRSVRPRLLGQAQHALPMTFWISDEPE